MLFNDGASVPPDAATKRSSHPRARRMRLTAERRYFGGALAAGGGFADAGVFALGGAVLAALLDPVGFCAAFGSGKGLSEFEFR